MSNLPAFLRQTALAALIGSGIAAIGATSALACDCDGGGADYQPYSGGPYSGGPYSGGPYDNGPYDRRSYDGRTYYGQTYYGQPRYGQPGEDCYDRCGYRASPQQYDDRYYDRYEDGYYESERLEPYRYYNPDYDDEYYDGGDCDNPDCD